MSISCAETEQGERPEALIERYTGALRALLPGARSAEVVDAVVSREHEATFRGVPGTARLRPGPETGFETAVPRRSVDGHGLARNDGGRGAQRDARGAARAARRRYDTRPRRSRPGGGGVIPTEKAPAVFGRARDLVAPAMRTAVGRLSAEMRPVAEYHFGWTDADGRPVAGNGGKGVRPALAVLSAEAVGADAVIGVREASRSSSSTTSRSSTTT